MLIDCIESLKMSQDSFSPVQHSAVFTICTNSRNFFGKEQTKFRILKKEYTKLERNAKGINQWPSRQPSRNTKKKAEL